jgi:hypothetical protein
LSQTVPSGHPVLLAVIAVSNMSDAFQQAAVSSMSDAFQQELVFLDLESSPAFVRAPEGNGYVERFILTLRRTSYACGPSTPSEDL